MDLQKGTFSLCGLEFGPATTAHQVYDTLRNKLQGTLLPEGTGVLRLRDPLPLGKIYWRVELDFQQDRLQRAMFWPLLPDAPASRKEAEAVRRVFCDEQLRKALGEPDWHTDGCTLYRRPYGTACAISEQDPRGAASLGCLVLTYDGGEGR